MGQGRFWLILVVTFMFVTISQAEEPFPITTTSIFSSQPAVIVAGINNSDVTRNIITKDLNQKKFNSFAFLAKITKQLAGGGAASPSIEYVKMLDDHQGIIPRGSGLSMKLGSLKNKTTSALSYADISAHATIDASWIGINIGW